MTHNTREVEELVEEFEKRMPLITSHGLLLEARLTPTSYLKMKEWLRTTIHHQLQKARDAMQEAHDFLTSIHGQANPDHCLDCFEVKQRAKLGLAVLESFLDHSELNQDKQ